MSLLSSRTLFSSDSLAIREVRCSSPRCGCGAEESSSDHSFAFVRSGVFVMHVRGRQVVADPNRVVLFSPDEPYRVSHPEGGGDRCITFVPSPALVREALAEVDPAAADTPHPAFPTTDAPAHPSCFLLQSSLVRALSSVQISPLAVEDAACRLIDALLGAALPDGASVRGRRPATTAAHRDLADAARLALAATCRRRISLPALAQRVHASPYHLSRVFHRVTGLTLQRYANRLRLREALSRLADGEGDLTRVALACGFYDHSHFANAFRREFGLSPSAIRRDTFAQMSNAIQV